MFYLKINMFLIFLLFCASVPVSTLVTNTDCNDVAKSNLQRLKQNLLCNYDKSIRPVDVSKKKTTVNFGMVLKYIDYMYETDTFAVHSWIVMKWIDPYLAWNPNDYDNIKKIHISSSSLWIPDFILFNSNNKEGTESYFTTTNCRIKSKGTVGCVVPSKHSATCIPNLKYWPFDKQSCFLRYGSWVNSAEEVVFNLSKSSIIKSSLKPNKEWDLLNTSVEFIAEIYKLLPNQTFNHVKISFELQRHFKVYIATIITPAIILAILSMIPLWMKSSEDGRFYLICVSIISHFTYLQFIHWEIPPNGKECPMIVKYFKDSLILSTFALIETIVMKGLLTSFFSPPFWLTGLTAFVLNSRPGQFLLLSEIDSKNTTNDTNGQNEDEPNIVSSKRDNNFSKEWLLFTKLIDRFILIIFTIIYLILFFAFIPK